MNRTVKTLFLSLLMATALVSCKNEGSIQTYFVEHQDLPDFKMIDISAKMIDISKTDLTEEQKETFNALEKINFLGYRVKNGHLEDYKKELEQAKIVFKNKDYNELMEFSNNGTKFRISSIGTDEFVDEILVLASSEETGFGVVRVLGDKMNPEKMVKLVDDLQNADVDKNQLEDIMNFFK